MASLSEKLMVLGFEADIASGLIILRDDGAGPYIFAWNSSSPQPTQQELDAITVDQIMTPYATKAVARLDGIVLGFVSSRYPQHRQSSLMKLQLDARTAQNTTADAYIQQCWTWISSCFTLYYQKEDEIVDLAQDENKTEEQRKAAIEAVISGIDFSSLIAADPNVTIRQAMTLLS